MGARQGVGFRSSDGVGLVLRQKQPAHEPDGSKNVGTHPGGPEDQRSACTVGRGRTMSGTAPPPAAPTTSARSPAPPTSTSPAGSNPPCVDGLGAAPPGVAPRPSTGTRLRGKSYASGIPSRSASSS